MTNIYWRNRILSNLKALRKTRFKSRDFLRPESFRSAARLQTDDFLRFILARVMTE